MPSVTDEGWEIEGEFRDGSDRVRDDDGQYQSVSTAILEELSEYEVVSASDIAARIGVDETVALEHLLHLRKKDRSTVERAAGQRRQSSPKMRFLQRIHTLLSGIAETMRNLSTETDCSSPQT